PIFRETFDRCDSLLKPILGESISSVLFEQKSDSIHQTRLAQPALFALEYSLLTLFDALGIRPTAMIGHSLGEVVAACWAGVFSLEDGTQVSSAPRTLDAAASG
ncbi:MAG: acyltransferase domain-containing protein, partial [Opitutales bacterium]|nr:acyltransferase domain-containing protein [Opitutales bacterium]